MDIKELDKNLISAADSASFAGNRGKHREDSYNKYAKIICSWDISESKKEKLLNELYKKNMEILKYEASHVSVIVAGPARYNAKKLDKSDKILQLTSEFSTWFEELEKQYKNAKQKETEDSILIDRIYRYNEMNFNITENLKKLAILNAKEFIRIYEEFNPTYKWRKNSSIYKMYEAAKEGKLEEKNEKILFEDENYKVYSKKDRIFIKFVFRIKRQLIFALKKKGFFWNSHEGAWSTYLERYEKNKEWTENISTQYSEYI